MDELIDYRCVDFQKLLILKAKSLQLSDQQCYVLLLIMTLDEIGVKPITPLQISKICSLSVQKLDDILMSLVDKHWISRQNGSLNLKPLQRLLLNQNEQSTDQDIVDALNESVKSGVITFRYIEKILDNWARYGVTKRYAPTNVSTHQEVEQSIKDYKWWENHE